jgi:putative hemolysin
MTILAAAPVAATEDAVTLMLGPYRARISASPDALQQALALRQKTFAPRARSDQDAFDPLSLHGTVTDIRTGITCVAFRVRLLRDGMDLNATYTGGAYGLDPLQSIMGPFIELGRVCQNDAQPEPMALRVAWAALTALVDQHNATMLVGCTSFAGADVTLHSGALAQLRRSHLGPEHLRPRRKSPDAIDLPVSGPQSRLPHLLKSYLGLGGWVSDHAVIDHTLETIHVFTGLCIADIPERRKRQLRALVHSAAVST